MTEEEYFEYKVARDEAKDEAEYFYWRGIDRLANVILIVCATMLFWEDITNLYSNFDTVLNYLFLGLIISVFLTLVIGLFRDF